MSGSLDGVISIQSITSSSLVSISIQTTHMQLNAFISKLAEIVWEEYDIEEFRNEMYSNLIKRIELALHLVKTI